MAVGKNGILKTPFLILKIELLIYVIEITYTKLVL